MAAVGWGLVVCNVSSWNQRIQILLSPPDLRKWNNIMRQQILFSLLSFIVSGAYSQDGYAVSHSRDTTIVGLLTKSDSILEVLNHSRIGTRYYYGVHHLKIASIDLSDSLVRDTMIIAYVYNMKSELASYHRNFDLKDGECYIFDLAEFSPCNSDFPRIEGYCKLLQFFPLSDSQIKHYKRIYRVINVGQWNGHCRKSK